MKVFISRNYTYDEETDYQVNVKHHTNHIDEAIPWYSEHGITIGWLIRPRYE